MAKVFISFVREDRLIADTVKTILENDLKLAGQVFMITDQSQVLAGDDWLKRIRDEINSADVIVPMMSKRSIKMPWVNFEAGAAWILGKRIISACFGNQRKGELPKPYSNWQAVQLPDDEQYLVNSIADHFGLPHPILKNLNKLFQYIEPKKEGLAGVAEMLAMEKTDLNYALKHWNDE